MELSQTPKGEKQSRFDEKSFIAFTSVLAAILLTSIKLVVGLMTNSLGILSEAIHSGMDLLAALMTFFAVRKASIPPDEKHQYGHGKIENFSALFETFILAISSVWIVYEAIRRIEEGTHVEANLLAFLVIIISIIVDISRSRALYATAKKYNSQALEADALHFSSDIWSSSAVLVGLILVWIANEYDEPLLLRADPLAAIIVAIIIGIVTFRLGMRTVDVLLDAAPDGVHGDLLPLIKQTPGVVTVKRLRTRSSGGRTFVDVIVEVPADKNTLQAHRIASDVEKAIFSSITEADIIVHIEPADDKTKTEALPNQLRILAARYPEIKGIHNLRIHRIEGEGVYIDLHAEFAEKMLIEEAHKITNRLEEACKKEIAGLREITVHIESYITNHLDAEDVTSEFPEYVAAAKACSEDFEDIKDCHNVVIRRHDKNLTMSLHCHALEGFSVAESHALAEKLEKRIRTAVSHSLLDIIVHIEPSGSANQENSPKSALSNSNRNEVNLS
ncbi:MAG: cation diffusion facilitator family transporter [Candidatus Hodarchaeota archaeon]